MATDVTQSACAEVNPAAPTEGMVGGMVRAIRCWTNPQIPIQILRDGWRVSGTINALRPNRSVSPQVNLSDISDGA
jgi:hypothetical protein